MEFLIIAPFVDIPTHYSSIVARMVQSEARRRNISTTALEGKECHREYLNSLMKQRKKDDIPVFDAVIFYGHGNQNAWLGYDDVPILDMDNVHFFTGSLLLGICCLSAKSFLKLAISAKINGAIGFTDILYLPGVKDEEIPTGTRNYTADFMRTYFLLPLCLMKGFTLSHTIGEFKDLCNEYYDIYVSSKVEFADTMSMWMRHNRNIIDFVGHPDTALEASSVSITPPALIETSTL